MSQNPIRVCITGGAGQIGYALLPLIAQGEMFGRNQPVIIHILEIEFAKESMEGVVMELQDGSYPLLHGVVATTNAQEAFMNVDYAILAGAFPRKEGMTRKDLLTKKY
jgi:malate/lactate dehydrogenase